MLWQRLGQKESRIAEERPHRKEERIIHKKTSRVRDFHAGTHCSESLSVSTIIENCYLKK